MKDEVQEIFEKYSRAIHAADKGVNDKMLEVMKKMGVKHWTSSVDKVREIQEKLRQNLPKWEEPPYTAYLEYAWKTLSDLAGEQEAMEIVEACIYQTVKAKPRGAPQDNPHTKYFTAMLRAQVNGWMGNPEKERKL